jgi:Protein of unknown function (DUF3579)
MRCLNLIRVRLAAEFEVFYKIEFLLQCSMGDPCARILRHAAHLTPLVTPKSLALSPASKQFFIQGITKDGKQFRPSDWAERLAGVMSPFRPGGAVPGSHLSYSEWCLPTSMKTEHGDVKCVVVHTDLRENNVMAWDFVMNFAKDNELQVIEACLLN